MEGGDEEGCFHTTRDIGVRVRDLEGNLMGLANTEPNEILASQLQQVARFTIVRGTTPEHRVRFSILNGEETLLEDEVAASRNASGLVGGKLSLKGKGLI